MVTGTLVNNHSGVVYANPDAQLRILQKKLETHVEDTFNGKGRVNLERIEREGKMLQDYIAPLGENGAVHFSNNGHVNMVFKGKEFRIHPHAVSQLGDKLNVPPSYIKDLVATDWGRKLARQILNEHVEHSARQRILIRTVGDEVRGVLTDQYRRLDSPVISRAFITAVNINGGRIVSAFADDVRMWIEAVLMKVVPIPTEKNGVLYIAYGARWSTSDFGDGAHDLRTWFMHVRCLNTAVTERMLHQVHLGARISDDLGYSERTYRLDTKTQASAVSDIVSKVFSKQNIEEHAKLIQWAANTSVDMDEEMKKLRKGSLLQSEVDAVRKVLMNNRVEDGVQGESTLWKLAQGITAIGRSAEDRRKRELEEIAGSLLERD